MVTDSSESVSNYLDSSQQLPPKPPDLHTAIIDTSTTGHFLAFQHQVRMLDQPQCPYTVTCQQAGATMMSTHVARTAQYTTMWTTTGGYRQTLVPGTDRVLTHFCYKVLWPWMCSNIHSRWCTNHKEWKHHCSKGTQRVNGLWIMHLMNHTANYCLTVTTPTVQQHLSELWHLTAWLIKCSFCMQHFSVWYHLCYSKLCAMGISPRGLVSWWQTYPSTCPSQWQQQEDTLIKPKRIWDQCEQRTRMKMMTDSPSLRCHRSLMENEPMRFMQP
jgi:hypothetical protein